VKLGRYLHQADSYHIYGAYFNDFSQRFLNSLKTRSFEERSYRYEDVGFMMEEAVPAIREKAAKMGREMKP
jgi:thymidylate synthase